MQQFKTLTGVAAALFEDNIDTDQLCPKQHLTALKRIGFASALFSDRRSHPDGSSRDDFILNQEAYRKAAILVAGDNFGCGSSREHAVWALVDSGIRCVIAPSYGDIFFQNSVNSGLLAIRLPRQQVTALARFALQAGPADWIIDLPNQLISVPGNAPVGFEIDADQKQRLIQGLDEIAMTLQHRQAVLAFEARQKLAEPWLWKPVTV